MAPRPETHIIVNCAGRTRGIIGTQSLINAGIPNSVAALRNGTIGWKLAHQQLAHGALDRFGQVKQDTRILAAENARCVADKSCVTRMSHQELQTLTNSSTGTTYFFDVRSPEEFLEGHLPDFLNAPRGQLVQETDMFAPVRGAHIVLADDDGVRANMTGSWLAQMGWNVSIIDGLVSSDFTARGASAALLPPLPLVQKTSLLSINDLLRRRKEIQNGDLTILDFATAQQYGREHIAGAWYALRSELRTALTHTLQATSYVLTSPDGIMAHFAYRDLQTLTAKPIYLLEDGTAAWAAASLPLVSDDARFASNPIDKYRRPYEGTDALASDDAGLP